MQLTRLRVESRGRDYDWLTLYVDTETQQPLYVITERRGGHELGVVLLDTPNPLDQVPALLRAGAHAEG